jgi:hypothetical protein
MPDGFAITSDCCDDAGAGIDHSNAVIHVVNYEDVSGFVDFDVNGIL